MESTGHPQIGRSQAFTILASHREDESQRPTTQDRKKQQLTLTQVNYIDSSTEVDDEGTNQTFMSCDLIKVLVTAVANK